jgi:hypothetical protein
MLEANLAPFQLPNLQLCVWLTVYMYKEASAGEIQTSAPWNLIGRSITAPPRVLSPSSILPPFSSHCAFIPAS